MIRLGSWLTIGSMSRRDLSLPLIRLAMYLVSVDLVVLANERTKRILVSFSLSQPSPIVLALSQLDTRYFAGIASLYRWNLDFVLYQKGFKEHIARSTRSDYGRSVNLELGFLPAGEYVVHVSKACSSTL